MTTAHVIGAFAALSDKDKVEVLHILAKNTPNLMNTQDHHIASTTTYLSNMLNEYHYAAEAGNIALDVDGTSVFRFIEENF